jgi:ankyrin repeat protein
MTGEQLRDAALLGDAAKVSTLLSTQGAHSFINYQDAEIGSSPLHLASQNAHASVTELLIAARCNVDLQDKVGFTPLHFAAVGALKGHETATKHLIAARCNVDLQANDGATALQFAEVQGHAGIATLIRNQKHKSADRGKKDTLRQGSPEEITKQVEDAHSFKPHSFKPHFLRHSQVLNSLSKPHHLGVMDGMVGFPHPQSIIQILLLFVVLVMVIRRCCLSRQLAYADVC